MVRALGADAVTEYTREDFARSGQLARELIEVGELRAVVDRVFPLSQIADAHRYAEARTCKGAVVLCPQAS